VVGIIHIIPSNERKPDEKLGKTLCLRDIHYQLLRCIETFIQWNGYSPSVRELVAIMGRTSTSHIHGLLHDLESKGLIRQTPGIARSIVLVRLPDGNNRPGQRSGAVGQD
jgi:SOS-response transcriptional repressor LexA